MRERLSFDGGDIRDARGADASSCTAHVLSSSVKDLPKWALPVTQPVARVMLCYLTKTSNDMILLFNRLLNQVRG